MPIFGFPYPEMHYWLVKSEPEVYSWQTFVSEGRTVWDGVRSYAARNHLQAMKKGDLVLYYHSMGATEITGIAKVVKEHYQDPTTDDVAWAAVDLKPVKPLKKAVTLGEIKKNKKLKDMSLVRISRLSVMPVTEDEFNVILEMAETKL